jgi:nucleoside 2-deoxyribosyltransferase
MRVYVASKVKHAEMWRLLRVRMGIVSTWIDEAGEGQTENYTELAQRCLREVQDSDAVVLFCEPREVLKGALLEVGAALAYGIPVCFT